MGALMSETLLVPLGGRSARALEVYPKLIDAGDPVVFPLAQLADGGRRVLRRGGFRRVVLAGEPPAEELGYGLTPLVAFLARPREVALLDTQLEEVTVRPLLPHLARTAAFALGQIGTSALLVGAQKAMISPREGRQGGVGPGRSRDSSTSSRPSELRLRSVGRPRTHTR
jgi:hypothetical protein